MEPQLSETPSLYRALICVEATRLAGADRERAQQLVDLFAWCGEGSLTANEAHSYLRPDATAPRPRAIGLLLRSAQSRHYLATACHVLSEAETAVPSAPQALLAPEDSETRSEEPGQASPPSFGTTEIVLDHPAFRALQPGRLPAASLPHLDLALIRLDQTDPGLPLAMTRAGLSFLDIDRLGEQPSADEAEIEIVGAGSAGAGREAPGTEAATRGRVRGLVDGLSFFWIDVDVPARMSGAPVVEKGRVVGFVSLQVGDDPSREASATVPNSLATIAKAARLKELLAAQERA